LSRIYANETNRLSILNYKTILKEKIIIPNTIVGPNELMVLGKMENSISISDYYFTHTVEFNISTSINGNITPVLSLPGNTYSQEPSTFSLDSPRFVVLSVKNTSSEPIEFMGFLNLLK